MPFSSGQTHLFRFFLTIGRLENNPSWRKDRRQPGGGSGQSARSYSKIGNNKSFVRGWSETLRAHTPSVQPIRTAQACASSLRRVQFGACACDWGQHKPSFCNLITVLFPLWRRMEQAPSVQPHLYSAGMCLILTKSAIWCLRVRLGTTQTIILQPDNRPLPADGGGWSKPHPYNPICTRRVRTSLIG